VIFLSFICLSIPLTQFICNFDFLFEENVTGLKKSLVYLPYAPFAYKIGGKNGSQGMFIVAAESHTG
jgi:hypothetical protein